MDTLDYLGKDHLDEGLKLGMEAVEAAEELLGTEAQHPLLALCLTVYGYFLKVVVMTSLDRRTSADTFAPAQV